MKRATAVDMNIDTFMENGVKDNINYVNPIYPSAVVIQYNSFKFDSISPYNGFKYNNLR